MKKGGANDGVMASLHALLASSFSSSIGSSFSPSMEIQREDTYVPRWFVYIWYLKDISMFTYS